MYKLSARFFIVILTFVIGIFAVAGWFYYQKLQPNQVIVSNARRDSLLFNGVSERGGINKVTELGELPKLREARLPKGDIEVRVWRGFGLSPLEGVVLRRIDGLWTGYHLTANEYDEPEKVRVKRLYSPKSGWTSFWKQLTDKEILTLPQSTENECDVTQVIDGIGYVVEINQDKIYRYYYYPSGIGEKCREAKQMNDIGEFIGLEFDSGQEKCKRAEWFPCMKVIKTRLFLQETTGSNDDEIANLFYSLRGDNMQERNKAKTQLLEISEKSSDDKERVITQLIRGTATLCKAGLSGSDFDQVRTMSDLLAGFQSLKALDVLIDCSNQRLPVGGLSSYNYPTMPAIFEYKMKALPKLKEKLKNSRQETKCQIATALSQIGGREAENSLKEALNNETEETVLDCLHNSVNSFKNKR